VILFDLNYLIIPFLQMRDTVYGTVCCKKFFSRQCYYSDKIKDKKFLSKCNLLKLKIYCLYEHKKECLMFIIFCNRNACAFNKIFLSSCIATARHNYELRVKLCLQSVPNIINLSLKELFL